MTTKDELTDPEREKLSNLIKKKNIENYKGKLESADIPLESITAETSYQDFNELYPEREYEWLNMADSHSIENDEAESEHES